MGKSQPTEIQIFSSSANGKIINYFYTNLQGYEGDITKYARGTRMNSKIQRDTYQKNINEVFKKQIHYLTNENPDNYISDSESSDYENLFETHSNNYIDLEEEDPKKGLNFMKNEIYSNPNNKKKKRTDVKR